MQEAETHPFAAIQQLLDLGGNYTLNIHRVEPGALFDLMQDGQLDELKRETRHDSWDSPDATYLVGKAKVNGIDVTLFSRDLPKVADLEVAS